MIEYPEWEQKIILDMGNCNCKCLCREESDDEE